MRAILVIELNLDSPEQIQESLRGVRPTKIAHFAGNVLVTMDAFGVDKHDKPATRIINYLLEEENNDV